ncbi:3'-5' exonuclease [Onthophagus taurus]|uniref:3'-5' exonuclease n=1 Tax=Onthophagus taurus TaxID=166361 RepID=UPI0039BE193D
MLTRSRVPPEEKERIQREKEEALKKKNELHTRPFVEYNGKVIYQTTFIDFAMSCDAILDKVKATKNIFPLGFDLEWPFTFQTGPGKVAVIQISPSLEECYVFHVSQILKLPKSLLELLVVDNVRLVGVNIKNDIRKLSRDFGGFDDDEAVKRCIDAGRQANELLGSTRRWSMEKLVGEFLNLRINKDKKVRNSQWHVIPLSKEQQIYAATDAYASLRLYHKLEMLQEIANKENNQEN